MLTNKVVNYIVIIKWGQKFLNIFLSGRYKCHTKLGKKLRLNPILSIGINFVWQH